MPAAAASSAASGASPTAAAADVDLASLSVGAFAVGGQDDAWFRLLDGIPNSPGIQVNSNPYVLVIALPSAGQISSFAFTSSPQMGVTPHHVKVEVATQGADGPWSTAYDADYAGAAQVGPGHIEQARLPHPVTAQWLRLTLSSPPEAAPYGIGLAQFAAFGTPGKPAAVRQVAGLYHFPLNFGASGYVLLKQEGAGVEGCYFEAAQEGNGVHVGQVLGTIVGGIEQGSYLRLTRTDQQANTSTPGVMAFSPDGQQVFTAMFRGDSHSFGQVDESGGTRVGASQLSCQPQGQPAQDPAAAQLQQTGRVQLYGVNFDLDRATLRPDAKPVLERMAGVLKAHPDWKIEVQGHTDSTGSDQHNLTLSQARATTVAQYLQGAGVPAAELTSKGYGASQPLMPNDTDIGRAQNRRVELVKQ